MVITTRHINFLGIWNKIITLISYQVFQPIKCWQSIDKYNSILVKNIYKNPKYVRRNKIIVKYV